MKIYAYKVYLWRKEIDKVFYQTNEKVEDVKKSLVEHDGYNPSIKVVKER
jgi:hypothetical protein